MPDSDANPPPPKRPIAGRPPDWKLPAGVAPGTWDYVHSRSIADDYDQFLAGTRLTEVDLQFVESILPPATTEGAVVADLGCGTGRTLKLAHAKGYRVLGIDLSQPMLRRFQQHSRGAAISEALPTDWALRANLVNLDCVASESVDHALCLFSTIGMIRQRTHRKRAISHFRRILRPGGILVLHAHNRWASLRDPGGIRHLWSSFRRSKRDSNFDFGDRVYGYRGLPNMFLHSYGRKEMAQDLKSAGLQVERLVPLSVHGEKDMPLPWLLPGLRAGGFMAIARRPTGNGL